MNSGSHIKRMGMGIKMKYDFTITRPGGGIFSFTGEIVSWKINSEGETELLMSSIAGGLHAAKSFYVKAAPVSPPKKDEE